MGLNLLSKLCRYRIFQLRSLRGFTFWMLGAIHTSATKSSPYKAASVTWRINASPVLHGIFTFREPVFSEHLQTPPFLSPPSYLPPTSLLSLCRSEARARLLHVSMETRRNPFEKRLFRRAKCPVRLENIPYLCHRINE